MPSSSPDPHLMINRVISFPNSALAIAYYISPEQFCEYEVMALDTNAEFVNRSGELDLWDPTQKAALAAKTPARGMAVVVDFIADEKDEYAYQEVATWFSFQRRGKTITTKRLGTWDEYDMQFEIKGWPIGDGYLWAGLVKEHSLGGSGPGKVIFGDGNHGRVPTAHSTDVPAYRISDPLDYDGDRLMVLQTALNRLELWSVLNPAAPEKVMVLAKGARHKQFFGAILLQQGDDLVAVWCEYCGGRKEQTVIKTARIDLQAGKTSQPQLLTDDDDVIGLTLVHATIDDSELFAWESRNKKGACIRAVRVKDITAGPYESVKLDADTDFPMFCLTTKKPMLIQSVHSGARQNWSLGPDIPELSAKHRRQPARHK